MIRNVTILILLITLAGCQPNCRTIITVRTSEQPFADSDMLLAVSDRAQLFGLDETQRRDTDVTFVGKESRICLTMSYGRSLVAIEITEYYTSYPTEQHSELAHLLFADLESHGYNVQAKYPPRKPRWPLLVGVVGVLIIAKAIHRFYTIQRGRLNSARSEG